MAISLGSNISALSARRSLDTAVSGFSRTLERLGSGARINRASDDAAGLAVATSLNTTGRVFSRARLNIGDGISAINIADGTFSQLSEILIRQKELAQQAANGSYSRKQRYELDREYQTLDQEFRRLINTTEFNGERLLKGNKTSKARSLVTDAPPTDYSYIPLSASADGRFVFLDTSGGDPYSTSYSLYDSVSGNIGTSIGALGQFSSTNEFLYIDQNGVKKRDLATGTDKLISATNSAVWNGTRSAFSADGSTVAVITAYSAARLSDGTISFTNTAGFALKLNVFDPDQGAVRQFDVSGTPANIQDVQISRDGTKVSWVNNSTNQIQSIDLNDTNPVIKDVVTTTSLPDLLGIKDTGEVIYRTNTNNVYGQIAGSAERLLLNGSVNNLQSAQLTENGNCLTFASSANPLGSSPSNTTQVYRLDLVTGLLEQKTNYLNDSSSGFSQSTSLLFSGDGQKLYACDTNAYGMALFDLNEKGSTLDIEVGVGNKGGIRSTISALLAELDGYGTYLLTSTDAALKTLDYLENALSIVSSKRGELGAFQSRLETGGNLLDAQILSYRSAEGRIRDADIGAESANLVASLIKQQTASAVLAQAVKQPELVLLLLGR